MEFGYFHLAAMIIRVPRTNSSLKQPTIQGKKTKFLKLFSEWYIDCKPA